MSTPKQKKQTVGYRYFVGMHMILCHGPIDGIKQIWVGEKCVWPNPDDITELAADDTALAEINQSEIFGGEEREGGISGTVDLLYGESTQAKNLYLISKLDPINERIPAFRGLVSAILNHVYIGTSAYLKPWGFLCKRTDILQDGSQQWYPAKSDISGDMNPAHIIRECLTNSLWGLGYNSAYIDDDAFEYAADVLYSEDFGLSFIWNTNSTIEDFINLVLKHIDGMLYQDVETGLFILKLAREDYIVGDLDVYDDSDIVDIKSYRRETLGEVVNQIVVTYTNVQEDVDATATAHDIAVMNLQGGSVIESTVDYKGVTKAALANKLAARDLRQSTSMLARMIIYCKRTMAGLRPNDIFKLTWPILGIEEMVVRVVTCNYGSLTEGVIELIVVEDVFQTASALYETPPDTEWENPITNPVDVVAQILMEVPYWSLVKMYGESSVEVLDEDAGFLGVGALKPSNDSLDYEVYVRDGLSLDFTSDGRGNFTPTATLDAGLLKNAVDATIDLNNVQDLDLVEVNSYAVIGSEIVKIKDVDTATNQITIARGVLDTVPEVHNADDRIWFVETISFFVTREYADGEQPGVKILPTTGKGQLDIDDATAHNADTMDSRQTQPYPPGDFKINSVSYPSSFSGQPTISWKHRDRLQQTVTIIEHSETNVGDREGSTVTYTLKIYDKNNVLVHTEIGLTGTSYEYTEEDERVDCGLEGSGDPLNNQLRFVLYSVRDGYNSWQSYNITVARV